ncbi:MAG: glycosyltransferase [Bacteroidales bacterium]|jgi:glycosyltransferase involved in cell wall biosynthesis|nr:glycosyltransferase [Bacteroidales bacterium]
MRSPLLSVFTLSYNHEFYIQDALNSFLMQKTNFEIEIIVADDNSTDKTQQIIQEYQNNNPNLIFPILRKENIGMNQNFLDGIRNCKGKYIALCEGDDYWTDPLKLQKQVDFLEANKEYSFCFHNTIVLFENKDHPPYLINKKTQKETLLLQDIINKWPIATASIVFKSEKLKIPSWYSSVYSGDYFLGLLLASKGPIGYIDKVMSVYRKQPTSLSYDTSISEIYRNEKLIEGFENLNQELEFKYEKIIHNRILAVKKINKSLKIEKKYGFLKFLSPSKMIKRILKNKNIFILKT